MVRPKNVPDVQEMLLDDYRELHTWRAVQDKWHLSNVSVAYRFVKHNHIPTYLEDRYNLGLEIRPKSIRPKPEWLERAVKFLREREVLDGNLRKG